MLGIKLLQQVKLNKGPYSNYLRTKHRTRNCGWT